MIKTIFLHIGVHKTASTTIQKTLYSEHAKLAEEGVLYPKFKIGEVPITNHSIPFYSLFCENPKEYHINIHNGITTDESIKKLHLDYRHQIETQIANFHGEKLIISGEGISLLSKNELINLKSYLVKITQPNVNIRIILICRHPVTWFRSVLQTKVKAYAIPMKKLVHDHLLLSKMYYNLIQITSEVFGPDIISVNRYEDIILHHYGPAGAFLDIIYNQLSLTIKPEIKQENTNSIYEYTKLINACISNNHLNSELKIQRINELNYYLSDMPGQKFMLTTGLSKKAWDSLYEDVNSLCNKYSLQQYEFINEDINPQIDFWSKQTLNYLKNIFLKIPYKYQKIILMELIRNSITIYEKRSLKKRKKLMLFVIINICRKSICRKS